MSGFDYFKSVLTEHYADFEGRARRSEYWYFMLFSMIITYGLMGLSLLIGDSGAMIFTILSTLFSLATIIPSFGVLVRRLHDTERSGWWFLIAFIPIIGFVVLIFFLASEGTAGTNKYGPDPKGSGTESKIVDQLV